jgi:hypothetical protein
MADARVIIENNKEVFEASVIELLTQGYIPKHFDTQLMFPSLSPEDWVYIAIMVKFENLKENKRLPELQLIVDEMNDLIKQLDGQNVPIDDYQNPGDWELSSIDWDKEADKVWFKVKEVKQ